MLLYLVITVLNRPKAKSFTALCSENGVPMTLSVLGRGTATSEILDLHGLEASEKIVIFSVADAEKEKQLFRAAKHKMMLDVPGNGIMMCVPVKSVGGQKTLSYFAENKAPDKEVPSMQFDYEAIMIILNQGYTDDVMDAARKAGADGGTVLHAKGTGAEYARKFLGVSLADEKEIILIAARKDEKTAIMQAVVRETGTDTPAGAIAFSMPISEVTGMRHIDD